MAIYTSSVTTATNGDLTINPNGTGEIKLTKLAGSGELPLGAANADGEVRAFDHRNLNDIGAVDANDLIMVQREGDYYSVDASLLGGANLADPNPPNISWLPSNPPGTGTHADPFRLTPVTVSTPGGEATSVETMVISGMKPDAIVPLWDESSAPAAGRFEQSWLICDNSGGAQTTFRYVDAPTSTSGAVYDGVIKVGTTTVFVTWEVTQQANQTIFGPASAPTASPTTVDYAVDGKYGTVSATWADGSHTLNATDMVFSVNGGALDGSSKSIENGDRIVIGYIDADVDAANEGDTIFGTLTSDDGSYTSSFSMVKDTTPSPFTIADGLDRAASTETSTGNEPIKGINAPTTISAAGTSGNPLTSVTVSVNGAAKVASGTFNPGDSLQGFGTTGAANSTTYQATFTLGGVDATWDVTTTAVTPTIEQPEIESPANGTGDLVPDVILEGSDYSGLNGAGGHASSTWEVYEAETGPLTSDEIVDIENIDGTWYVETMPDHDWRNVAYGGGTYVAVAPTDKKVAYSSDGISWTLATTPVDRQWYGVTYADNRFIVAGYASSNAERNNTFLHSPDGITWTAVFAPETDGWQGITHGGGRVVAVGNKFPNQTRQAAYSTDGGSSWTQRPTPSGTHNWTDVAYGNNTFVAIGSGNGGKNMYSTDGGENWTLGNLETFNWRAVTFGQGKFVAVAPNKAAISEDGIDWTPITVPCNQPYAAHYANGKFMVMGTGAAYSYDGVNWFESVNLPSKGTRGVTYGDKWVAVGDTLQWSLTGTGTFEQSLIFASDKNLDQFIAGNAVEQSDEHTPQTGVLSGLSNSVRPASLNNKYEGPEVQYIGDLSFKSTNFRFSASDKDFPQKTTGKYYMEMSQIDSITATAYSFLGFGDRAGKKDESCGMDSAFGNGLCLRPKTAGSAERGFWVNGAKKAAFSNNISGDYYGLAIDFDEQKVYAYSKDTLIKSWKFKGTAVDDMAAYPWVGSATYQYAAQGTVNFGATPFKNTGLPADFLPWGIIYDLEFSGGLTGVENLVEGDIITQDDGLATGRVYEVNEAENKIVLSEITGTWTAGHYAVGPTKKGLGTILSIDTAIYKAKLAITNMEWCKNVGVSMVDPSIEGFPGAPTTEPPSADYTAVTPSAETLTTATLDDTNLNEDRAYYSRVKYSDGSIESEFSEWHEFGTADSFILKPGDAYGGGYYAGQINDGGTIYNLIVAPKTSGGLTGFTGSTIQWKTGGTDDGVAAQNQTYGLTATQLSNGLGTYPMFDWVMTEAGGPNAGTFDASNATGTGIGGYNDWYIPARNELAIVYFFLKPSTTANHSSGSNPDSVAPYTPNTSYTTNFPNQTTSELFQSGGSEAFTTSKAFWAATQGAGAAFASGMSQSFSNGQQLSSYSKGSPDKCYGRAIRRVPA